MAVFDPAEQRMCIRVVYDGAAGAGKTTNLRQLGGLFAAQRSTEVTSPAELRGRTLYFDWMQIAAGVVCGFPLICQVISVPGQVAFTERRRYLLSSADAVVYVCESTKAGAERARDGFGVIDTIERDAGIAVPVIVQANKQDQLDVLDGKRLVTELRRPELSVVEAIATEGIGVVDTFVTAVRLIARTLQARMERDNLRIPVRVAQSMGDVLTHVAAAPIDPYGAAELVLEEASAAMIFESAQAMAVLHGPAEPVVKAPLPTADVPTGFIWPAHTGRAILRKLASGNALAQSVSIDGDVIEHSVQDHVMATSPRAHFAEPESARQALVRGARERTQLGTLLVSDTVLVVQPSGNGGSWLWTVTPAITSIESWLEDEDPQRLDQVAAAFVQAVEVALRHDLGLLPSIRAFGVQNGSVRYRGPIEARTRQHHGGAYLLHSVASELGAHGIDLDAFTAAMERELTRRLEPRELQLLASEQVPNADTGSHVARELVAETLARMAQRHPTVVPEPFVIATRPALATGGTSGSEVA